ncbi:DNA replication/repair protein RecF [Haematospirillum jordaniae]|uniref:DNA replication and repair protein RecF n=1 Tax=Haematospirillum jordaniae TaxID=1549855 RepID=A0A143DE44_9PROT|nr:DNA replication/repair protein RecF [Haematospirillum jordaniae]AMW34543.1 DNA replication/repair protein RecF [Haematospirillum jordaniae]
MSDTSLFPAIGVSRLVLTDFRSWSSLQLEAGMAPVVLTGANGSGKTNLLEALSFLAPGRGLRRARLQDVTRSDHAMGMQGGWGIAATVHTADGPVDLGTGRDPGPSDRRVVRINGINARSQTELGDIVSIVWLTPVMDRLFTESPSGRRRFLDRLVFGLYPGHAGHLSAYEKALRQRTGLLRDNVNDPAWIALLENTMASHGVAIAAARQDITTRLNRALSRVAPPFPRPDLGLNGWLESLLEDHPATDVEDLFRQHMCQNRRQESAGMPAEGPHRTDLKVHNQSNSQPAARCSTGEQKALLLSILLAQARIQGAQRGTAPLLLLDEVAAHLDAQRREALFEALIALGAQAWLTGTDRALFEPFGSRAQFFNVSDGQLH